MSNFYYLSPPKEIEICDICRKKVNTKTEREYGFYYDGILTYKNYFYCSKKCNNVIMREMDKLILGEEQ